MTEKGLQINVVIGDLNEIPDYTVPLTYFSKVIKLQKKKNMLTIISRSMKTFLE